MDFNIPQDIQGEPAFLLSKHFNSITSGNDMKWDATERTEGAFTFTNADAQVAFAKANNMHVRCHTLVWHNQTPAWVFNDANGNPMTPTPENKALLLQRLHPGEPGGRRGERRTCRAPHLRRDSDFGTGVVRRRRRTGPGSAPA